MTIPHIMYHPHAAMDHASPEPRARQPWQPRASEGRLRATRAGRLILSFPGPSQDHACQSCPGPTMRTNLVFPRTIPDHECQSCLSQDRSPGPSRPRAMGGGPGILGSPESHARHALAFEPYHRATLDHISQPKVTSEPLPKCHNIF